ncbi:MAG: hypothetical protein OER98_08240 [Gammaproteobacteria bacterium]|nr:hypothetical protein [Gammaproteobacteria bacterium]
MQFQPVLASIARLLILIYNTAGINSLYNEYSCDYDQLLPNISHYGFYRRACEFMGESVIVPNNSIELTARIMVTVYLIRPILRKYDKGNVAANREIAALSAAWALRELVSF